MDTIESSEQVGRIVRRVRDDRGMSRAELSRRTGVGLRTIYALETGESPNFGLSALIRILNELDLNLAIGKGVQEHPIAAADNALPQWSPQGTAWDLQEVGA